MTRINECSLLVLRALSEGPMLAWLTSEEISAKIAERTGKIVLPHSVDGAISNMRNRDNKHWVKRVGRRGGYRLWIITNAGMMALALNDEAKQRESFVRAQTMRSLRQDGMGVQTAGYFVPSSEDMIETLRQHRSALRAMLDPDSCGGPEKARAIALKILLPVSFGRKAISHSA